MDCGARRLGCVARAFCDTSAWHGRDDPALFFRLCTLPKRQGSSVKLPKRPHTRVCPLPWVHMLKQAGVTGRCSAGKPSAAGRAQTFPDLHTALEEYSRTGDMSVLQGMSSFLGSPDQVGRTSGLLAAPLLHMLSLR